MQYVAVLITCFNRVQTTLKCLKALFEADVPDNLSLEVFLVDDASPDKTGQIIKDKYPLVNVIYGSGKLYWCGGMRLAWQAASNTKDYDFYILLNDDTYLLKEGLTSLFKDYMNLSYANKTPCLVMGACCDKDTGKLSYTGKKDIKQVDQIMPDGTPQKCLFACANLVLVPRSAYLMAGGLSEKIIHRFGDYEYTYRVNSLGGTSWISSQFCAYSKNEVFKCYNPDIGFLRRWKLFYSPIGLSLHDNIIFKRLCDNRKWLKWLLDIGKKHFMCFCPELYMYIKRKFL